MMNYHEEEYEGGSRSDDDGVTREVSKRGDDDGGAITDEEGGSPSPTLEPTGPPLPESIGYPPSPAPAPPAAPQLTTARPPRRTIVGRRLRNEGGGEGAGRRDASSIIDPAVWTCSASGVWSGRRPDLRA